MTGKGRGLAAIGALSAAFVLGACQGGAVVNVDIRVPRPLVEPIDATVGVYFDDKLRAYVHNEELDEHGAYSIDIGASQAPVFAQVFEAMFRRVVRSQAPGGDATAAADGAERVDGILAPSIEEVQFAIPEQTGGEFYEVWIRYKMRVLDAAGAVVAEWPLIGYGKANKHNYASLDERQAGLYAAAIWALRDAAALLSFQFRDQPVVQRWLASIGAAP